MVRRHRRTFRPPSTVAPPNNAYQFSATCFTQINKKDLLKKKKEFGCLVFQKWSKKGRTTRQRDYNPIPPFFSVLGIAASKEILE